MPCDPYTFTAPLQELNLQRIMTISFFKAAFKRVAALSMVIVSID